MSLPDLQHPTVIALASLAANIAANHPEQGLRQVDRLRHYGVLQDHIDFVVEIARHIREEAGEKLDLVFDQAMASAPVATGETCCTHPSSGK